MALGDVAPAGVERSERAERSMSSGPASLELLGERGVHRLAHERRHAHVPARSLTPEPGMLGVGQADRDATHGWTVPHFPDVISPSPASILAWSVRVVDHLTLTCGPALAGP